MDANLIAQHTDLCAKITLLTQQRDAVDLRIATISADQQTLTDNYQKQHATLSADRLKARTDREALSVQIANLSRTRDSLGVELQVQDHVSAAAAARTDAERLTKELADKSAALDAKTKEADELIAKLKTQLASTPEAAAPVAE